MNVLTRIKDFEARAEQDPQFCAELFEYATVRLLAFKYAYYVLSGQIVHDKTYDAEEQSWYVMGRALKQLEKDETSPCIDWNNKHPLAEQGKLLAEKLLRL